MYYDYLGGRLMVLKKMIDQVVDGVKAKNTLDSVADVADSLKGFFGKK